MAEVDLNRWLADAGYTAVGLGILAFQRVQVRRREVERTVRSAAGMSEELVRWALGCPRDRRR